LDPLPRRGRKPKPENEEETKKQEEEKEQSKLRKRENYNAARRGNYTPKIYLGPVLGDAMRPTENKKIKLVGPFKSHNQRSHQTKTTQKESTSNSRTG
jgi:hypothetical protein